MGAGRMVRFGVLGCIAAMALSVGCKKSEPGVIGPGGKAPGGGVSDAGGPMPAIFNALPADTIFVLALTDIDKMKKDFEGTALHEAWMDPKQKAWREQGWPKVRAALEEKMEMTFADIDQVLRGDILMFVAVPEGSNFNDDAKIGFVVRTAENRKQIEALIQKLSEDNPPEDELNRREVGDVLVFASDAVLADEVEANLKARRSSMEGSAAYEAFKNGYSSTAFAHLWLDLQRMRGMFTGNQMSPTERAIIEPIIAQTGIGDLLSFYMSSAMNGKEFRSNLRLETDGERTGVLAWAGANAQSRAAKLTPGDSVGFMSVRHAGVDKILETIKSIATSNGQMTEMDWRRVMAQLAGYVGFNLEVELPRLLGNEIAFASTSGSYEDLEFGLYIESNDPGSLIQTIESMLGEVDLKGTPADHKGVSYRYFAVPLPVPIQVCLGQIGDFVVVASKQEAFKKIVDVSKGAASLADNPEYKTRMANLGSPGWAEVFGRFDPVATYGADFTEEIPPEMMAKGISEALEIDLSANEVFDLAAFYDHLRPSAGRAYADRTGLEYRSESAVSGMMAAAGLGALAVPNFLEAQTRAKVSRARADMRSLATACEAYYVDWNAYPYYATGDLSVNAGLSGGERDASHPSFHAPVEGGIGGITTPIAYITRFPTDPFAADGGTFMYWSIQPNRPDMTGKIVGKDSALKGVGWIMVSAGPDGDFDIAGDWDVYDPAIAQPSERLIGGINSRGSAFTYDPTNGTKSNGDIWRVKY